MRDGKTLATAGDPELVTFFRSSAKPFQALPLVRARDDLELPEIAIACASHRAEPAQLEAVLSLLSRARATETDLECGVQEGRPHEPLYHNCSGKHAGFLALCRASDWLPSGYRLPTHPVQRAMVAEVCEATGVLESELQLAVDGCGVVTFALSLERMAVAFSRLGELEGAPNVMSAMLGHPELIGGQGSADTALMQALPGWLAKGGAEGLFCARSEGGVGIVLKVEDGNHRATRPALALFLSGLGVELGDDFAGVDVLNSRGEVVGEVTAG